MTVSFRQILESLSSYETQQVLRKQFEAANHADGERMRHALEEGGTAQSDVGDSLRGSNYNLNRYTNVVPFNHNRVRLSGKADYINATHVTVSQTGGRYIATQGPLGHTRGDFWRMVWEQQAGAVVMLANPVEQLQSKCAEYWPTPVGEVLKLGDLSVSLGDERPLEGCLSVIARQLKIARGAEERAVMQLHYTEWPDHGVPQSPVPMIRIMQELERAGSFGTGPVVVHCSAGVGRTGSFIVLDAARRFFRQAADYDGDFVGDVFGSLRTQRTLMVQTFEQYLMCYQTVHYMLNSRE